MADDFITRREHEAIESWVKSEFQRLSDEDDRQNERIGKLENLYDTITDLTVSVNKLAENCDRTLDELTAQSSRIKTLESRDGEKWRSVVSAVISAVVGGLITLAVTGFFGG